MRKLTGFLIDVVNKDVRSVTIDDTLEGLYSVLGCDLIDFTVRKIGFDKEPYGIICDDEGLLKSNPIISAFDNTGEPCLVGNLLIVQAYADPCGNWESLKEKDIDYLKNYIMTYQYADNPDAIPALYPVSY